MSLLILSTIILLADGLWYISMGMSVLWAVPCLHASARRQFVAIYLSIFKDFIGVGSDDAPPMDTESPVVSKLERLAWRFAAYTLLMLGVIRAISSLNWGCGYVLLGLITCVGEIGIICNELLCYDSANLHRAMAFVLHNVAVSLLYIGTALPFCTF